MSFFREIAQEFRNEFEKASAEFVPQSSVKGFHGQPGGPVAPHAAHHQHHNQHQQAVVHHAPPQNQPPHRVTQQNTRSEQQRPQTNKQRRKASGQASRQAPQQTVRQASATEQPQARAVSPVRAHQLVANLNPVTARSAIIMSEVLGPPVSKRQRKTWR